MTRMIAREDRRRQNAVSHGRRPDRRVARDLHGVIVGRALARCWTCALASARRV